MLNRRSALCSLALVTTAALGWMGCESQKQTELVAGISTQVQVPRDLKTVQVSVSVEGTVTFCKNYLVYDNKVQLPRSLGALPRSAAGTPVIISVTGFTAADSDDPATPAGQIAQSPGYGCAIPASVGGSLNSGGGARVLRVSRQPYSPNQILFVPMPLKFSCFDVECGNSISEKTCKAGRCVDSNTQVTALTEYNDNLLYGGDGTCFALDSCFSDQVNVPPLTVDDAQCIYALPGAIGAPPGASLPQVPGGLTLPADGLNVRVAFDSGLGNEILDLDKDEGFFVPDATKPQIFQLAPGLCDLVHGTLGSPHRITSVTVNPVCRPKLASQSICAADQLKLMGANPDGTVSNPQSGTCSSAALSPVASAVEFVIDPTKSATDFLAAAASLLAKKNDPAFANLKVGFHFMPVASSGTCPSTLSPMLPDKGLTPVASLSVNPADYAFDNTWTVQNQVAGLETAYAEIIGAPGVVNKTVIMIANKGFIPTPGCVDPQMGGAQKVPSDIITAHKDIPTTVVEIGSGAEDPCNTNTVPSKAFASAVASTGGSCYNASVNSTAAQTAIIRAFTASATCTYTAPKSTPDTFGPTSELWFSDPTFLGNTTVIKNAAGKDATACHAGGDGWVQDAKGNVVLCKNSCDAYQNALQAAAVLASAATPGSPKFPSVVPIFALSGGACVVKASSGTSTGDGGSSGGDSGTGGTGIDAGGPGMNNPCAFAPTFNIGTSCDLSEQCPVNGKLQLTCGPDEAGAMDTCQCLQDGVLKQTVSAPQNICAMLGSSTLPAALMSQCGFTLK